MNGQFLMNKAITVQYAFKKDGKGERHGTAAERLLAAQARKNNALPVTARPPPAPIGFGAGGPPMPGYQAPYQGQFAGVLAQPPPPPGFTPQQTIMPSGVPMPMGMPMGMPPPPPPPNIPLYNPQGQFPPPPPPPPSFVPPGVAMMAPPMGMQPPY
jgi:splicing factor 3B subunit 4